MMINMNRCFVCNYNELLEPPFDEEGVPSDEICPCCGIHYGYDDDDVPDKEAVYKKWRDNWVSNGCVWFSKGRRPPVGWNSIEQLNRSK